VPAIISPAGDVPDVWQEPATPSDFQEAVPAMLTLVEPDASAARASAVTRYLERQGYTRAELILAVNEVPKRNNYGKGFRLDIVEDVIREHRKDRARLQREVSEEEMHALVERYPEVRRDDFHCSGYAPGRDSTVRRYRYVPDRADAPAPDVPELPPASDDVDVTSGVLAHLPERIKQRITEGNA